MDDTTDVPEVDQYDHEESVNGIDMVLAALVQLARNNDGPTSDSFGVTVTLAIPGGPITGMLVGPKRWRTLAKEAYASTVGLAGLYAASPGEDDLTNLATHVHLIQAAYVSGGRLMPKHGSLFWRGRLSQVAGWSIGSFAADD